MFLTLHITWHKILHVHGLLPLPVVLDADGGQAEEDGGAEGHGHAHPGDDVGPVVLEGGGVLEGLGPRLHEQLDGRRLGDLEVFVVLHGVPQAHRAGGEQA